MIGMPVLVEGHTVGAVSGVDLDGELRHLSGVWVNCGMRGTRYIARGDLKVIGEVSILASSAGRRTRERGGALFMRALSTDGTRLGAITDAMLEEETLCVSELELSSGYFDDLISPRARVRQYAVSEKGDVIVCMSEGGEGE